MKPLPPYRRRRLPLALVFACACGQAGASELVYYPVNPTFGGNPNNASGLLSTAQAQNGFRAPQASPLQTFNDNLQRAIFSRLSSDALTALFGKGSTLAPGTYETAGFTIKVTDIGNGAVTIETTDKNSGASVSFTVSTGSYNVDTSGL
jgi:curli production assembly/transport component CsgF